VSAAAVAGELQDHIRVIPACCNPGAGHNDAVRAEGGVRSAQLLLLLLESEYTPVLLLWVLLLPWQGLACLELDALIGVRLELQIIAVGAGIC
jgi:hypothetical protein